MTTLAVLRAPEIADGTSPRLDEGAVDLSLPVQSRDEVRTVTASAVPDARMVLIARGTLAAVAVVQVAWLTFVGYVLLMLLR